MTPLRCRWPEIHEKGCTCNDDYEAAERAEGLLQRDWADEWDSLPEAPEIVPKAVRPETPPEGWDVYRDENGQPVTIDEDQLRAIWHAIEVVERVRAHEQYHSLWDNPRANLYKSRLLGRLLLDGRPPTRDRPPTVFGGPAWWGLLGGDPYDDGPSKVVI